MPYIKHALGKTFYLSKGRQAMHSLPLIGLHGGPGSTHQSRLPLFQLANNRKVYVYDQIGGGKSTPTAEKYWTIDTFTQELHKLIQAWGLKRFHLYGGSWGTTLALEYFLRYKNNGVASIVFQSPLFSARDWSNDAKILIKKLPKQQQKVIYHCQEVGATDAKVYKQAMHEYYKRFVQLDEKKLLAKNKPHAGRFIYQHMWGDSEFFPSGTLKNYDRVSQLKKVNVPVLLICGQHDEARPVTAQRYAKLLPHAQYITIKGASHSVLSEKPKQVIKHVRDFLNEFESNSDT